MDNQKIESFLAVAQTRNFSKAAELLYINQSVVSRRISSLESELGVKLFERTSHYVTLTKPGKLLETRLSKMAIEYSNLLEEVKSAQSGYLGEITIYVHPGSLYNRTLIPYVIGFEKRYPNIRISLLTAHTGELRRLIHESIADFVFARWDEYEYSSDLSHQVVTKIKNGLLIPSDHQYISIACTTPDLSYFKNDSFVVLPDSIEPGQARRTERYCWASGFDPNLLLAPDVDTSLLWLEARRGISIVNADHIFTRNPDFSFITLENLPDTEGSFIWNICNNNQSAELFKQFLQENP